MILFLYRVVEGTETPPPKKVLQPSKDNDNVVKVIMILKQINHESDHRAESCSILVGYLARISVLIIIRLCKPGI